jgi:hypothetical protein
MVSYRYSVEPSDPLMVLWDSAFSGLPHDKKWLKV